MKTLIIGLLAVLIWTPALSQDPAYNLTLKNDTLVGNSVYEFDIYLERTGGTVFELAQLQAIMTFNPSISVGSLSFTMNSGSSQLRASQQPTSLSIAGNELRINPQVPPGVGNGTTIPPSPGLRVGRFRITSSLPFSNLSADVAWKNSGNPYTKVFAYNFAELNVEITDSTRHLESLANPALSPPVITTTSPLPGATAGSAYTVTLEATGGTPPYTWSNTGGSLPSGLTLSSAGVVSGQATIANTYNFRARVTDDASASAEQDFSITVSPGAAAQLEFVQQPTNTLAGVFISPPVSVRLKDAYGNNKPTAGVAITMSLTSGNGTLSGSLTEQTNASGVATFDSLRVDRKGDKVITATSSVTSSRASNLFTIGSASPTQIRVETAANGSGTVVPAQSVVAGNSITVYAVTRDAFDNFVDNVAANSWLLQSTTGGVVAGDLVPSADSRSATFTGHILGSAQIRATSPPLTAVNSGTLTVTAGPAKKLVFIQQPTNAVANAVISPAVTVQVRDSLGNNVAAQNLSVGMDLGSGTGTLLGTTPRLTGVSGLATFNDLRIDSPGVKTLTASSTGLTSATSNSFSLSTHTITASAGPNGTISPSGTISLIQGANQTFTITPGPGYHVDSVIVDGAPVGPVTSYTFTNVTANHTISASFSPDAVQVTIQTSPPGRTIRVDGGGPVTAPQVVSWIWGSTHTIATDSAQTGAAGVRYFYSSWSDAGALSHTVTPTSDTTFTARFNTQYYLTTTAGTGGSASPASAWKDSGEVVSISATADPGYSFTGWTGSGAGSYSGPTNAVDITMNGPIAENAGFSALPVSVTVTTNPAGRQIVVDGTTYTSPQTFNWTATQSHTITTDSIQAGAPGARYLFASWSDAGARSHTITPLSSGTYTAVFTTQYYLTMSPGAGGTTNPPSDWKNSGQVVPISGTPNTGYSFSSWTGSGTGSYTGTTNPVNITMNGPVTQSASFAANQITVTVTTDPVGQQINVDGTNYTSPRTFNWYADESHVITTDSIQAGGTGIRTVWSSWSDAGARSHIVTPLSNTTYTARFTTQYYLTMNANPGGTVEPPAAWYDALSSVLITATPDPGYTFNGWSGIGSGSYSGNTNPRSITIGGPITETANFKQLPVQVTIVTNPPNMTFRVDGSSLITNIYTFSFDPGETHTVTTDSIQSQTTESRYVWTNWSDGGARSHTLLFPGKDTTITVYFKRQFRLTMNAGAGGSVSPPSGWYDTAQVVGISAAPTTGYTFAGWTGSGPGSYNGPNNPGSVIMRGAITQTAGFTLAPINVTVNTTPAGRTFLVDGTPYTGPQVFVWSASDPHTLSATSPQGDTATRYLFSGWSDGGSQTHSVSPLTDTVFTVSFSTQHYLAVDTGLGGGTVSPANNWYNAGQAVQVSATPFAGYNFGSWTGTGSGSYTGTNNPATVTMNGPIRETANFTAGTIPVTVTTSPSGRSIRVDGTVYTAPQTFNWTTGSVHTIGTDSLQNGGAGGTRSRFTSWSDAGAMTHVVAPTSAVTYTANFATQYLLTMQANPGGTVDPPTGWYDAGTGVTITGIPDPGFSFSSWTGTGNGSYTGGTNPRAITVNGAVTEIANFVQNPYQVVVRTEPAGRTFRVSGTNYTTAQTFNVSPGNLISLSIPANPQSGPAGTQYVWNSWSDSGSISHNFTPTSDTVITAYFTTQYFLTMNAGPGGGVSPSSGWFDAGSGVVITATPGGGYTFIGWTGTGAGSYSGLINPATVTMNGPITETAGFTLFPIQVRLRSTPPGRTIFVDTVAYVTPQDLIWTSGETHTVSGDSIQDGATGVRYLWTGWSDGGTRSHSVTGLSDTTFTMNFRSQYYLAMNSDTGGSVSPPSGWFDSAASVPIIATAGTGYTFSGWTGSGTGSYSGGNNPSSVSMLGPVVETAHFGLNSITVTIRTEPDGYPVIVDDTVHVSPKTFSWTAGSAHTIATDSLHPGDAGTRRIWNGWSDGGTRVHVVAPLTDSVFTTTLGIQYYLTMNANPGGSVTPSSGWNNAGQSIPITGIPNSGFTFSSWSGSGAGSYSGTGNPRSIIMNGPITQTANFSQNTVLITVRTEPPGRTFRVDNVSYTSINTFSLLPGSGHTFSTDTVQPGTNGRRYVWTSWSDSGSRSHTFTVPFRDSTVVVTFGTQFELITASIPPGGGTITPGNQSYHDRGDTVSVLAVAAPGYAFTSWSGDASDTLNPIEIIMDTAKNLTAIFEEAAIVGITTSPSGRTVVIDGQSYVAPVSFNWLLNSTHTVGTITPQDGDIASRHLWSSWSDTGSITHSVTVDRDTIFHADFRTQHYLFIGSGGNGTAQPVEGWHDEGTTVEIAASPDSGYGFIEWLGQGPASYTGFSNPVTLTMDGWAAQTANFGTILPPPDLSGIPDGAVDQPIIPRLDWNRYPGATSYIVQVATDSLFSPQSNVVDTSGIPDSSLQLPELRNLEKYFWRVKARVGPNISSFSGMRNFTTIAPTITVTSPGINWGTTFTYDITWTTQNLSGPVNVLLSADGGLTFSTIAANLTGTSARWTVPLTQTPSNFCVVRVASASKPEFYSQGPSFAIVPGSLPLIVPISAKILFPDEPTISTFYRLVSSPGVVDTTIKVNTLIPGQHPDDWRMFADNGLPENYLVEMGPVSHFETGRGYWLLKRNDLDISVNMVMPPLDTNNAIYRIRLRPGWNILANPFDKSVGWSSVLALNGLAPSTELYTYEGSYQLAPAMAPFHGYYFFNGANLIELKIPYPFGASALSGAGRNVDWQVRLEYSSDINTDPANFIGVSGEASEGKDDLEGVKPPLFLDQGFLYFRRPDWNREYSLFSSDFRPEIGEGQTWDFEVYREQGTTGTIRFDGIGDVPAQYEVFLVSGYNSSPYDLRRNDTYAFRSVSSRMPFRLLIGTKQYVEREAAAAVPVEYELMQNFPNPFNSTTSISVKLPRDTRIRLDIYSVLGEKVATIADGEYQAGTHTFLWEGTDDRSMPVSSGVYYYKLTDGDVLIGVNKMILAK